jgi:hypothetical protein
MHEGCVIGSGRAKHREGQEARLELLNQRPLHCSRQRRTPFIETTTYPGLLVDLQGLYSHHLKNLTFSLDKDRRPAATGEERIETVDPALVCLVRVESHTLLQINSAVLDVDLNGSVGVNELLSVDGPCEAKAIDDGVAAVINSRDPNRLQRQDWCLDHGTVMYCSDR